MQSGTPAGSPAGPHFAPEKLAENGIECRIAGEERFEMLDYEFR